MKTSRLSLLATSLAGTMSILALSGCSANFGSVSSDPVQTSVHLQGLVHGGQQPLAGAHVYMYQVSTKGYGSASLSLLTSATGNPADTNGNFYAITDNAGDFSIGGAFTCTGASTSEIYLYAVGGNPQQPVEGAPSTDNPHAGLLATLGTCTQLGSIQFVSMNENTTIAAAYGLAAYATDATHIGSSGSALAVQGVLNAGVNALNLVDQATGLPNATLPSNAGATVPVTTINTLADILASCINSSGGSACTPLFSNALSAGTTGTAPTDTATTAINIAHNPGINVSGLLNLANNASPFQPIVTSVNDFTLGVTFSGGGISSPSTPAIDAAGNVWIPNSLGTSVTEISSAGAFLSGVSGYTGGSISWPGTIAIDTSGDAWIQNFLNKSVTRLSSSGGVLGHYTGGGMANGPNAIAVDAAGNAWIVTGNANGLPAQGTVSVLSPSGTFHSGTKGYTGGGLDASTAIAIDGAGNAWVTNVLGGMSKVTLAGTFPFGASGVVDPSIDSPSSVALDAEGNAWVLSSGELSGKPASVLKMANDGTILLKGLLPGRGLESVTVDGVGNAWVTNENTGSVSVLSPDGTVLSGTAGYRSGTAGAVGLSIDGSGDVWIVSIENAALVELIGAAPPVITPLAAALPVIPTADGSSSLGTRP
jgi:streptogramin lyase